MNKKVCFSFLFSLVFIVSSLHAQDAFVTAGGNAVGVGGSMCYTVGQIIFEPMIGSNGTIIPGVQQPFEISIVSAIGSYDKYTLASSVYPNPVKDELLLIIENELISGFVYKIFDIRGILVDHRKIESNKTIIDMSSFVSSVYVLKVINDNKEVITYKIVKN
jgi:hypothetical protein